MTLPTASEQASNYAQARATVEAVLYERITAVVDEAKDADALAEDFNSLADTGKYQQIIFLDNHLQVLFSSYAYMLIEAIVKAGNTELATSVLERYGRLSVGVVKPIQRFW